MPRRLRGRRGLRAPRPTHRAVYDRLGAAGPSPLATLFSQVRDVLAERLAPYVRHELVPFAAGVYALDQTRLDPVAGLLEPLRGLPRTDPTLLAGTLAGIFDLRRQQWQTLVPTDDPHVNERVSARSLVATLPVGSLILADLSYFGFKWFDDRTDAGYLWLSRLGVRRLSGEPLLRRGQGGHHPDDVRDGAGASVI